MDFQRCIHDMVMKFKFPRHFLTRKRLIFQGGFVLFFLRSVPVATPNLLLNLWIGGKNTGGKKKTGLL